MVRQRRNWGKSEKDNINNVLILAGGEVLLKTTNILELYRKDIQTDVLTLKYEEFIAKYGLPDNKELWAELKEGVKLGKYNPNQT